MLFRRMVLGAGLLFAFSSVVLAEAQSNGSEASTQAAASGQQSAGIPVFRSTTTLVYLDATVVDKNGNPVVTGLTKDDFTITEDKQPQRIFSFEEPDVHGLSGDGSKGGGSAEAIAAGKAPETILVLDLLNTQYSDFAFVRDETRKFLMKQPEELAAPAEMLVLGNSALTVLLKPTRSRQELLAALDRMPRIRPYKAEYQINFIDELIRESYDALQQIAIQNRGVPGRKNVIWIGAGPPNIAGENLPDPLIDVVQSYVRHTVNLMVEGRITLFQINPGLLVGADALETKAQGASVGTSTDHTASFTPFSRGEKTFSEFSYETGGSLFNENDVSVAIQKSVDLGSKYYTLTYQPQDGEADGRFRRIEVKLRNPDLHVVTKEGYFSREKGELADSDNHTVNMLRDVVLATVPFPALNMRIAKVVRHPDTHSAEITLELDDKKLHWQATEDGKSSTTVIVTAVSRSGREDMLASRIAKFYLLAASQDEGQLENAKPTVKIALPVPRDTKNVRLALATEGGERIGSVDVDRKTIDAAPEAPTPQPQLVKGRRAK
jgi:VWFA-related protein